MGFRGQQFAFDSPAAAVAGLIARLSPSPATRSPESVPLAAALGRILGEPVVCDRDSPAFDASSMDGYAVRAADLRAAAAAALARGEPSITLAVAGECRIGTAPPELPAPNPHPRALRIATGSPVPPTADAVIKREDLTEHADSSPAGVGSITLSLDVAQRVKAGDHVRRRGENALRGDLLLSHGSLLSASSLGALAAVGCVSPSVYSPLRVALITTGDELVPPHAAPGPYEIRNANAVAVGAMLRAQAWINLVHTTHIGDAADLASLLRGMIDGPLNAQAIVLSGGVSMGHRDPVRAALDTLGAAVIFHGLPQRPGKPMLAATLNGSVPIFGLPGNPVSAMVTCTRIVLPVLAACAGASRTPPRLLPGMVRLAHDDGQRLGLWWHRPVRLAPGDTHAPLAHLIDTRGSGDKVSAAISDGFIELPPHTDGQTGDHAAPSSFVPFYAWPL